MDIKLTPKKSDKEMKRVYVSNCFDALERAQKEHKSTHVSTLSPGMEEVYTRHTRFFKSLGAKCNCTESKHIPGMSMSFEIDKKFSLSTEQLKEFLAIVKEQCDSMEIAGTLDGKIRISYTIFNALTERRIK